MVKPVADAKLTWRCRELADLGSIWILAFGACAIVVILAIAVPWGLDQIPRHGLRRDLDIELAIVAGLLAGLAIVVRGLTGSWNLRDLPRVDRAAGLLHIDVGPGPVAYRLAELGDITVEPDRVPRDGHSPARGYRVVGYRIISSTAGRLAWYRDVFGSGPADRAAAALRALIAALPSRG